MSIIMKSLKILIFVLFPMISFSQKEKINWMKLMGENNNYPNSGRVILKDMVVDDEDNIYQVGWFNFNSNFENFGSDNTIFSNGEFDAYIVKYDKNGNLIWAKTIGGEFYDVGESVIVLEDGNILFGGGFLGTVTFPNDSTYTSFYSNSSGWQRNGFLMKMNKENGEVIWINTFKDSFPKTQPTQIEKLKDSKYLIRQDRTFSVYDSNNSYHGSFEMPYASSGGIEDFTANNNGDIFLVGSHTGSFSYDGDIRANFSNNSHQGYIMKLDKDFDFQWIIPYKNGAYTFVGKIDYDESKDNIVVWSHYRALTNIDPLGSNLEVSPYQNNSSSLIASYDNDGKLDWYHEFEGSDFDNGRLSYVWGLQFDKNYERLALVGYNSNDKGYDVDLTDSVQLINSDFIGIYDNTESGLILKNIINLDRDDTSNDETSVFFNSDGDLIYGNRNPSGEILHYNINFSYTSGTIITSIDLDAENSLPSEGDWKQVGENITLENSGSLSYDGNGYSVASSADGSIIVVGASQYRNSDISGVGYGNIRAYELVSGNWQPMGDSFFYQDESADYENVATSFSLSDDGLILAIAFTMPTTSDQVQVFKFDDGKWNSIGSFYNASGGKDDYNSVSLNSDGTILAIGSPGLADYPSKTQIFSYDGTNWMQLGSDLVSENDYDKFGSSVSINSQGDIIIIGSSYYGGGGNNDDKTGTSRVYQWDGSSWNQKGNNIDGEFSGDHFGISVDINSLGDVIAIGGSENNGPNGVNSGHARVFEWDGNSWVQVGNDLDGEFFYDNFGVSVSLNASGNRLAVGGEYNDASSLDAGHVRVFEWNFEEWTQLGRDIDGDYEGKFFGRSLDLNDEGSTLVVGAAASDDLEEDYIKVFSLDSKEVDAKLKDNFINGENKDSVQIVVYAKPEDNLKYRWSFRSGGMDKIIEDEFTAITTDSVTVGYQDISSIPDGYVILKVQFQNESGSIIRTINKQYFKDTVVPSTDDYDIDLTSDAINSSNSDDYNLTLNSDEINGTFEFTFEGDSLVINNAIISMEDGMIYASGGNVSKVKKKKKVGGKIKTSAMSIDNIDLSNFTDGDINVSLSITDSLLNIGDLITIDTLIKDDINMPLTFNVDSVKTLENTSVEIELYFYDEDKDTLVFSVEDGPWNGTVTIKDSIATYTPNVGYTGLDFFTFKANDKVFESNVSWARITVDELPAPLSTQENNLYDIKIYPNPTSEDLILNAKDHVEVSYVKMIDYSGKEIDLNYIKKNKDELYVNVSSFDLGIYLLKIKTEKGIYIKKLIIE